MHLKMVQVVASDDGRSVVCLGKWLETWATLIYAHHGYKAAQYHMTISKLR